MTFEAVYHPSGHLMPKGCLVLGFHFYETCGFSNLFFRESARDSTEIQDHLHVEGPFPHRLDGECYMRQRNIVVALRIVFKDEHFPPLKYHFHSHHALRQFSVLCIHLLADGAIGNIFLRSDLVQNIIISCPFL